MEKILIKVNEAVVAQAQNYYLYAVLGNPPT